METLLRSLDCPIEPPADLPSARTLVEWLEDRKVRSLEERERAGLRPSSSDEAWMSFFSRYLASLGCPFIPHQENLMLCLGWLTGFAVSLEHEDLTQHAPTTLLTVDTGHHPKDGDRMQIQEEGEEIRGRIEDLCARLGVHWSGHEDDVTLLDKAAWQVRLFLKRQSIEALDRAADCHNAHSALEDFPLGFDVGDKTVNDVSVVLRMLYLDDLRELQHDLNALIALGQEYTANPYAHFIIALRCYLTCFQ